MEDTTTDAVHRSRGFPFCGDVDFVVRVGFVHRFFACTSNISVYCTPWFIELVMRIDDTSLHTI